VLLDHILRRGRSPLLHERRNKNEGLQDEVMAEELILAHCMRRSSRPLI